MEEGPETLRTVKDSYTNEFPTLSNPKQQELYLICRQHPAQGSALDKWVGQLKEINTPNGRET